MALSLLQQARLHYHPKLPRILQNFGGISAVKDAAQTTLLPQIGKLFPLTGHASSLKFVKGSQQHRPLHIGVVLSGGQAPGGHNVITGLYDAIKKLHPESMLIGFLNGPSGIVKDESIELTGQLLAEYRNQGGFDLLGSGRTKIETEEQFKAALETVRRHNLNGLVIVGGDDSNTNAAFLAEYFASHHCETCVVGVPKTIDGDLKSEAIEVSFGFDTASKHYSETIGSLMRDVLSAGKYYYFIKLMGRTASHITLECALQTHPNLAFISEEIAEQGRSLKDIIWTMCDLICARSAQGKEFGVFLIPEGLIEFIPEVKILIGELNELLATTKPHHTALEKMSDKSEKIAYIEHLLSSQSLACFQLLPKDTQAQLLIGRDPHGNVQVSQIETERMMLEMVKRELKERTKRGEYKGAFSPLSHFCGYEGRSCLPSNFDCQYCYALGHVAALLVDSKATGYMSQLRNLAEPVEEWIPGGVPLTTLMTIEQRHGTPKPVVRKALVDLKGKPFEAFKQKRQEWLMEDDYVNPGPIQFFGPPSLSDGITLTLAKEQDKQDKQAAQKRTG